MNEHPRLSLQQRQDVILTYEDRKRSVFEMPCVLCLGAVLKIRPLPGGSGDNWQQLRATCRHCGLVEIIPRSDHPLENPAPLREDGGQVVTRTSGFPG